MGETVEFATANGPGRGYLATPEAGSGPGVIVIQEWWGLNANCTSICDRFAAEGFVALAPDLYRGESTSEPDEAGRMMQELKVTDAARDLGGAVDFLIARCDGDRVGVTGYCMGGALALVTAHVAPDKVGAVDAYYGVFWYGEPDLSQLRCPVVMRVGTDDEFISVEKVEQLAEHVRALSGAPVEVEVYEGAGHAFFNDSRPDAYHEDAARRAWASTLAFFRRHLT